jgi:hypothetical protein
MSYSSDSSFRRHGNRRLVDQASHASGNRRFLVVLVASWKGIANMKANGSVLGTLTARWICSVYLHHIHPFLLVRGL